MRYDASNISFDGILRKEILMTLLDVKHVQKIYKTRFQGNQVEALKDIHFTVEKGDYVAIMGESGSGKSVLTKTFTGMLEKAVCAAEKDGLATVFGYWVNDPQRYGVAEFDAAGNCLSIEEKPSEPKSNYAVVGLYFYPNKVVEVAKGVKPSVRGELEITSVNQTFLTAGELKILTLGRGFAWLDTGTHDSLSEASIYIETIEKRQGLKVACLEEIAYRKGWIDASRLRALSEPMLKNQYGQYLLKLSEGLDA